MPRWNFECPSCHSVVERTFVSFLVMERAMILCPACQQDVDQDIPMTRLTPAVGFTIRGYNARTGYTHKLPRSHFEKVDS